MAVFLKDIGSTVYIWSSQHSDMTEGNGRLIHSDGDIFIGMWKKDKANGKG